MRFCVERDEGIGEGSDYLNKMVSDYSDFKGSLGYWFIVNEPGWDLIGSSVRGFISGFVDEWLEDDGDGKETIAGLIE